MSNSSPQISVLMTAFNVAPYLDEAISSIRNQTFKDFEFIIINDGSNDGSAEILDRHAGEDERIRLFHLENQGRIAVLNYGLSLVKAPLVAVMDADDIAMPDRLQKQWQRMSDDPGLGVLGSHVQLIDSNGVPVGMYEYPLDDTSIRKRLEHTLLSPFAHPASMIRVELMRKVGGYRSFYRHCEDYELWLRLAEITCMGNLDEPLLQYRWHGQNVSVVHSKAQILGTILARGAARARRLGFADPTVDWHVPSPALFDALPLSLAERRSLKNEWAVWTMEAELASGKVFSFSVVRALMLAPVQVVSRLFKKLIRKMKLPIPLHRGA